MTEPLTIKDLNCTMCDFAEETNSKEYPYKCTVSKPMPMMVHTWALAWQRYSGCASHPLALQVLARSAIEKLESAIREDEQICAAIIDPEGKAFRRGEIKMAKEAIKLLKGEAP
jgi:hypothetical protein